MFIISVFDQEDRNIHTIELEKKYDFVSGIINLYNRTDWVKCYTIVDKDNGLQIADFEEYCKSRGLKTIDKNSAVKPLTEFRTKKWFDDESVSIDEANILNGWMEIHSEESGLKVTTPIEGKGLGHDYVVEKGNGLGLTTIQFQNGPIPQVGVNGLTNEALLSILIHRTSVLNNLFPCQENEQACNHMLRAKKWFDQRTINRKTRGVEGTHQK